MKKFFGNKLLFIFFIFSIIFFQKFIFAKKNIDEKNLKIYHSPLVNIRLLDIEKKMIYMKKKLTLPIYEMSNNLKKQLLKMKVGEKKIISIKNKKDLWIVRYTDKKENFSDIYFIELEILNLIDTNLYNSFSSKDRSFQ